MYFLPSAPKDMNQTFATIIHAAPKLDVKELIAVRQQLAKVLAPEFVRESDVNYDLINPVVSLAFFQSSIFARVVLY